MRKHVIAYLHTHWDREWYREFETFRLRFLRVFDNVLDLLSRNKIPSFYLDGQVSALEDYLEMRPQNRELVENLVKHKRLFIGPFYCLIDEFLTDKMCFSKNLEIGLKIAEKYGCKDFIGYLPDTFGHSKNVVDILRDFGIDKCIVWRGCGDFPAEFKWCGMDTINLVRGYFHDVFSLKISAKEKAKILKKDLDLISEKSPQYILLPIGADHLGVECDIENQIEEMNELLKDDYYFTLSSPFDYFRRVEGTFNKFQWNDELRDNSKTFTLQGCYSSRLDLKRENVESMYLLDLASKFAKEEREIKYDSIIEYAYKLLLQNQAHDSICGCSTDDVHRENEIRYKKIKQIAIGIIDELKFQNNFNAKRIINLSDKPFSGIVEFESSEVLTGYDKVSSRKGFEKDLLSDTSRIPVTEDFKEIFTYLAEVKDIVPNEYDVIMPSIEDSDLKITKDTIENSNIKLQISDNDVYVNGLKMTLTDFSDLGDSYNSAPKKDDAGHTFKVMRSKIILNCSSRVCLKIDFEGEWDVIPLYVSLDKNSNYMKFKFDWENLKKNHLLSVGFILQNPIRTVFSEDMNVLIKREFDPEYDIRKNLPHDKGLEAKTNTAPMQRGLLIDEEGNNIGIVTKGLTQYEVFKNQISIPILRPTGQISNPKNPARTTPAGPPIEADDLQMIKHCSAEFYVFFGNENAFYSTIEQVYKYVIV